MRDPVDVQEPAAAGEQPMIATRIGTAAITRMAGPDRRRDDIRTKMPSIATVGVISVRRGRSRVGRPHPCPCCVTNGGLARPKGVKRLSKKRLVVLAVPLLFGVWLGYLTTEGLLSGGLNAAFALAGLAFAGVILVVHAFVALLHLRWPNRAGRPAARSIALSAALFIAGLSSGWLAAIGVHAVRTGGSASLDGSVLVAGGSHNTTGEARASTELFDPRGA